jgi:hypothetical protein
LARKKRERGAGVVAEERGYMGKRRFAEAEDSLAEVIKGGGFRRSGKERSRCQRNRKRMGFEKKRFAYG